MGLLIKHDGRRAFLMDDYGTPEKIEQHLRNGYPKLLPAFLDGTAIVEEHETMPEPTPEEIPLIEAALAADAAELAALQAQREEASTFHQKLVTVVLNHENRIRALEQKAPITRAQLITALRNMT